MDEWSGNSLVSGAGLFVFPDGDRYEGQWRQDRMWGRGTYTTASGRVFEGYWENNRLVAPAP